MTTTPRHFFVASVALVCLIRSAQALPIFVPGDQIYGGISDGTNFTVGAVGVDGGNTNYFDNFFPLNETPDHVIDNVGQKYLNFAELNTGFLVTPSFNNGNGSIVNSMTLWTANDAPGRDPATYSLFGTNVAIPAGGGQGTTFLLSDFTLISSGSLALPATRQPGGNVQLGFDALGNPIVTSEQVTFANSSLYRSYLVIFPTVKDEPTVNSMQIGEVQLDGVPEPSTMALLCLTTIGLAALRRRRR